MNTFEWILFGVTMPVRLALAIVVLIVGYVFLPMSTLNVRELAAKIFLGTLR